MNRYHRCWFPTGVEDWDLHGGRCFGELEFVVGFEIGVSG